MNLDRYELISDDAASTYSFESKGPKGRIEKIVQFTPVSEDKLYNLGFGDKNPETGVLNDEVITDNSDTDKVLATVVAALYKFCDHVPEAWVYATGSTRARTRLYRMGINKYFDVVGQDFEIYGEQEAGWEPYQKGADYLAFAVKRKMR